MPRILSSILILVTATTLLAQPNTEIYLMDLEYSESEFSITNFKNLSNNKGYDSQPSFYDNEFILYARTNEKATDIAKYHLKTNSYNWVHYSTLGGEYSPLRIPNSTNISAVRLDTTGLQRLYNYNSETKTSSLLIENLQVAYYSFYDSNTILSSVLSDNKLDLVLSNLSKKTNDTLVLNVGRSIHKVPSTKETMSYTSVNEEGNLDVFQLDLKSLDSFFVTQLPIGIQDHIWLDETTLLIGSRDKLFLLDLFGNGDWKLVADLSEYQIKDITRLAISPDGKRLALVAEAISDISKK